MAPIKITKAIEIIYLKASFLYSRIPATVILPIIFNHSPPS
jgi:hypothetical protein